MRTFADSGPVSLVFIVKIQRTVLRELFSLGPTWELGTVRSEDAESYV